MTNLFYFLSLSSGDYTILKLVIWLATVITLVTISYIFIAPIVNKKLEQDHEYNMKELELENLEYFSKFPNENHEPKKTEELIQKINDVNNDLQGLKGLVNIEVQDAIDTVDNNLSTLKGELSSILDRLEKTELKVFNGIDVNTKPDYKFLDSFVNEEPIGYQESSDNEDIDDIEEVEELDEEIGEVDLQEYNLIEEFAK